MTPGHCSGALEESGTLLDGKRLDHAELRVGHAARGIGNVADGHVLARLQIHRHVVVHALAQAVCPADRIERRRSPLTGPSGQHVAGGCTLRNLQDVQLVRLRANVDDPLHDRASRHGIRNLEAEVAQRHRSRDFRCRGVLRSGGRDGQ